MELSFRLKTRTPEVMEQIERGLQANLKAAAMIWHGGILEELTGEREGRTYRIPGTEKTYQASKPGEPPASRVGDLRRKYTFRTKGHAAEVGNPLEYAYYLEKGTRKMAPRPHVIPAYEKNRDLINKALGANVI